MIACKKVDVQFTYSPEAPRAGQSVTFTNHSSSGEEWAWTFGDGYTSSLKSPTHVFKKPGTYRVMLKVDNKTSWTAAKEITVTDTVPTFVCADSTFVIYHDYTFVANVYNPYNYDVEYIWYIPEGEGTEMPSYIVITDTTREQSSISLYFTRAMETKVGLIVMQNGDTTKIEQSFHVADRAANSILMRTEEGDFRQRIFPPRAEVYEQDASAKAILDAEQDTMQIYNGRAFRLSELKSVFPAMEGFHIANRKIYVRMEGLWVANIDGTNQVQIDASACTSMTIDLLDNRIYWANGEGVWYMPLIGSDNNQFVTTPTHLNDLKQVSVLAADTTLRFK